MNIQFKDLVCDNIAEYIQTKLNEIGTDIYGFRIINTIRNWDDRKIPVNDYPCLKVFREGDVYNTTAHKVTSQIKIEYGVVLSPNYKYIPALNQIGKYIHYLLLYSYIEQKNIMISNTVLPTGRVIFEEGAAGNIIGYYQYVLNIEDYIIPSELTLLD